MARTKRKSPPAEFVSKTGETLTSCYCRNCMQTKHPREFFQAFDILDTNGLMSVCKDCVTEIYDNAYMTHRTVKKAVYETCKTINVVYDEAPVESVITQVSNAQETGRKPPKIFSTYLVRLTSMRIPRSSDGRSVSGIGHDLTFASSEMPSGNSPDFASPELVAQDDFWGDGYTLEQIDFLEREYARFRVGYDTDDYAAQVLFKRICTKQLQIREAEIASKDSAVAALEKQLIALMKELAISPAHQTAAAAGRNKEAFGVWIEDIERLTPAEWLERDGKDVFYDVDGMDRYCENFITRPIKNFLSGIPNYNVEDSDGNMSDWDKDGS